VPLALVFGIAAVGKYSPPSVTFLIPAIYMLFGSALSFLLIWNARGTQFLRITLALIAALSLTAVSSGELIDSLHRPSYQSYVEFLQNNFEGDGRVLANLNTAFAFGYDRLLIWRDLEYLDNSESRNIAGMIDDYDVQWIVYSNELEYIHSRRPVWNDIYGNPIWYPELLSVLEKQGTMKAEGFFPGYSIRIVPLMDRGDWKSQIYRID
jgi:hypothetical protein